MLTRVKVFTQSKEEKIIKNLDGSFRVWVKEKPINGAANQAVKRALAVYLGLNESKVRMVKGFHQRSKIFDIAQEL